MGAKVVQNQQIVKQAHFVPQMLQRRFSSNPDSKNPLIWKLEKETGKIFPSSIRNEMVIGKHTRLEKPAPGLHFDSVENLLAELEGAAGLVIDKLMQGTSLTEAERTTMALFVFMQDRRTPRSRQWLTFAREEVMTAYLQTQFADADRVGALLGPAITDSEVEAWQPEMRGKWPVELNHDT